MGLTGVESWRGSGLTLVVAPDSVSARGILRAIDQSGVGATRIEPGVVPMVVTAFSQLRNLYLDARDLGGAPGHASETERARLGIEGQAHAVDAVRELAAELVSHSQSVHDRDYVAEPLLRLSNQGPVLATVLPDARYLVVVPDPCRHRPGEPDGDPASRAERWAEYVEAATTLRERLGDDHVMLVRPDQLTADGGVDDVCDFLDIRSTRDLRSALEPPTTELAADEDVAIILERVGPAFDDLGFERAVPSQPSEPATSEGDVVPEEVSVWKPQARRDLGYIAVWRHVGRTLASRRELVWQLFKRDFVATFRKSYLGLSWLLIGPLLGIVQWLIIQRNGILVTTESSVPYPLYVLVGTTLWGLFLGVYTATKASLSSAGPLLLQLRFPAEALVIQKLGQQLATFIASFAVIGIAFLFYGVSPAWQSVFAPAALIPLTLFATAIGLIVAMVSVVAIDVDRFLTVFWGLVLWLTPVVYSQEDATGWLKTLIDWNPMTYLLTTPRDLLIDGVWGDVTGYAISSGLSLVLFLVATRLFHVSQPQLVERLV